MRRLLNRLPRRVPHAVETLAGVLAKFLKHPVGLLQRRGIVDAYGLHGDRQGKEYLLHTAPSNHAVNIDIQAMGLLQIVVQYIHAKGSQHQGETAFRIIPICHCFPPPARTARRPRQTQGRGSTEAQRRGGCHSCPPWLPSSLNAANLLRIDAIWGPAAALETLVKGELTAGEAEAFVRVVEAYTKVLLAHDFEQRLARLEQDQNESWQFIVFGGLRESTARKLLAE